MTGIPQPSGENARPRDPRAPLEDCLTAVYGQMAALGVVLSGDLLDEALAAVSPAPFKDLFSADRAGPALVAVWNATFNKVSGDIGLLLTLTVRHVLSAGSPVIQRHLGGLKWPITWCFVHIFLAGLLYDRARQMLADQEDDLARRSLESALASWTVVEGSDQFLQGKSRRIWRGQRGVTQLILARQHPDPVQLLQGALQDLTIAGERGDDSREHFCYLLETLTRLGAAGEPVWDEADRVVADADERQGEFREWLVARADFDARRAQSLWFVDWNGAFAESLDESGEALSSSASHLDVIREALSRFQSAIMLYSRALTADMTDSDRLLRAKRGLTRVGAIRCLRVLGEPSDEALDEAIADLRHGMLLPSRFGVVPLVCSLQAKAVDSFRRRDFSAALEVVLDEFSYCEEFASEIPETYVFEAAVLLHGVRLELLLDEGDQDFSTPEAATDRLDAIRAEMDAILLSPQTWTNVSHALVYGCRALMSGENPSATDVDRVESVIRRLAPLIGAGTTSSQRGWLASHLGTLTVLLNSAERLLASASTRPSSVTGLDRLRQAYGYFSLAMSEPEVSVPRLPVLLARSALQLGKVLQSSGREVEAALSLFEEARDLLESYEQDATNGPQSADTEIDTDTDTDTDDPAFRVDVSGFLGEVYLRIHAITRRVADGELAITWLERWQASGKTSPQVLGLLGDANYRIGRDRRSVPHLRTALDFKERARTEGSPNRENLSVSAAAHESLWRMEGQQADYASAVDLAVRAHLSDREWPWPLLQLADLAGADPLVRSALRTDTMEPDGNPSAELMEEVRSGDVASLYRRASETAIRTRQFEQTVLGGRSSTFVLNDPHRLLSTTLVIKPTVSSESQTEERRLHDLTAHLRQRGAPPWMQLPVPLASVPLPSEWRSHRSPPPDTALAMRRASGRSVAALIADSAARNHSAPIFEVGRVLKFLAWIHTWSGGHAPVSAETSCASVVRTFRKYLVRLGADECEGLISRWTATLPDALATAAGRDAHAENWLVTPDSAIVALDLELHLPVPILYEVVQLLEDHPLLPHTEAGWSERLTLCRTYLDELARVGAPVRITDEDLAHQYHAFATIRAVFLGGHVSAKLVDADSTGSRQFARARLSHAVALLDHVASHASNAGLRAVACDLRPLVASQSIS